MADSASQVPFIMKPGAQVYDPGPSSITLHGTHFDSLYEASRAARDGDVILIGPGTNRGQAVKFEADVKLVTTGPVFWDFEYQAADGKGGFLFEGLHPSVVGPIELVNYGGTAGAAAIRIENPHAVALNLMQVYIHDGEGHGILTGNEGQHVVNLVNCKIERSGDGSGQVHNLYMGEGCRQLNLFNTTSNDCNVGHLVKNRGKETVIVGGVFNQGRASRSIDQPWGGVVIVSGGARFYRSSKLQGNRNAIGLGRELDAHNPLLKNGVYAFPCAIVVDDSVGFGDETRDTLPLDISSFCTPNPVVLEWQAIPYVAPDPVPPPIVRPLPPVERKYQGTSKNLGSSRVADVFPPNRWTVNGKALPPNTFAGNDGPGGLFSYSGVAFVPGTRQIVFRGGGQSDYWGTEFYQFDLDSQKFTRLTEPLYTLFRSKADYFGDPVTGAAYIDEACVSTNPNEPIASHMFDYQVGLPAGVAGLQKGGVLLVCLSGLSNAGQGSALQTYLFDLSTTRVRPFATNLLGDPKQSGPHTGGYDSACYDPKRKCVWTQDTYGKLFSLDVSGPEPRGWVHHPGSWQQTPYYGNLRYVPSLDSLLYLRVAYDHGLQKIDIRVWNLSDPSKDYKVPTLKGAPPPSEGGMDFNPELNAVVYYPGDGSAQCYLLDVSSWTWSTAALQGDRPHKAFSGGPHFSRLRYVGQGNHIWLADTNVPAQQWTIAKVT